MTDGVVAQVALDLPIRHAFSYRVPEALCDGIRPGCRVRVPFGPRSLVGFVLELKSESKAPAEGKYALKDVQEVLDAVPLLSPHALQLAQDIAKRWFCGPGEALTAFVPAGVKRGAGSRRTAVLHAIQPAASEALAAWPKGQKTLKQKEILELVAKEEDGLPRQTVLRLTQASVSPVSTLVKKGLIELRWEDLQEAVFSGLEISPTTAPALEPDQAAAAQAIREAVAAEKHVGFLLFGVTGSGKTEVYLDAIQHCLARGKSAIVLVPEISLTPQTLERFESRFGTVAVLHSHLTDAARARQWNDLNEGRKRIAIGPRSAVFAPLDKLGLIILDEEHEGTFKQQNVPRYHTRDVAMMRAAMEDAVVVLGSATPSLESWEASERGRLVRLEMPNRISKTPMPQVSCIDLRSNKTTGPGGVFSPLLISLVRRNLDRGEQTLLFLNRRGFRTAIKCRECGFSKVCRHCDVPMTFYKSSGRLLCHHCGAVENPPSRCPDCGHGDIKFQGFGTELVEDAARTLFAGARIARMDSESMRQRNAHEEMYRRLKAEEIDILIGTQMVAKGLDFPGITLIGVVAGDSSLLLPDFRAAERTFQLMTQVSGRAGRGRKSGRVIIQTWTPDHYSFVTAARHDFPAFAAEELRHRREMMYPPFGKLLRIIVQALDESQVQKKAEKIAAKLHEGSLFGAYEIRGPAPAPISFLKNLYRYHLVVRAEEDHHLEALFELAERDLRSDKKVQVLIDRDPTSMM
ncbi:MAG: primosomal protein N' [Planctomycetota bacterium]